MIAKEYRRPVFPFVGIAAVLLLFPTMAAAQSESPKAGPYELNDSHFHLTNYIQEGTDIRDFLKIMGTKVGRVALFGIPLQQTWSYQNSGNYAPTYYLQTDAPLYYYSFTDAYIAMTYRSLNKEQQARFDPMITGFNPSDMYAADHVRRVLKTFPGVFSGIGEFTIHKEFVSSKVTGETASLQNPALDRLLDFCAETGLVALIHSDVDMPFAKKDATPVFLDQMKAMLRRNTKTTIIWAHLGLGRVIQPLASHTQMVDAILKDPDFSNVYFDISWDETAKYLSSEPDSLRRSAEIVNRYPDRFLFGTDEVAPSDQTKYLKVYEQYRPLLDLLTPEAREKLLKKNYERLFDAARLRVRAWERENQSTVK